MRRLLVTGGAGFIGSNFIRYWTAHRRGDSDLRLSDAGQAAGVFRARYR